MSATRSSSRNFSASYRSHKRLNDALADPALPQKTRKQLLKDLRAACSVMLDSISYKEFRKMTQKNLQLVVKLGPSAPHSCYAVKNIYSLWSKAQKEGKPFRDPLTRNPVTHVEQEQIMRNMRALRPAARDLLAAQRTGYHPAFHLNVGDPVQEPKSGLLFYPLSVVLRAGSIEFVIKQLGYFPVDEPREVVGSADLSVAALLARISALVDSRKLFVSALPPIACCQIALPLVPAQWTTQRSPVGSPLPRPILNAAIYREVAAAIGRLE